LSNRIYLACSLLAFCLLVLVFQSGSAVTASLAATAAATARPDCPALPPMGGTPPANGQMPQLPPGCQPMTGMGGPGSGTPIMTDGVTSYKDVAYATKSAAEKLDLYVPSGKGPFPLVINIHGGAFKAGDKTMLGGDDANPLLAAGYAVATINYRLTGEAIFPAQINDAKAAVRFLRAKAKNYNLDPARFATWGQSAGGNIAMLVGTSDGVEALEDKNLGNPDISSAVQAVISFFGPVDFAQMDAQFAKAGTCPADAQSHSAADSPESILVGGALQTKLEVVKASNPITYIGKNTPPFFLQAGTADCTVPPQQSQLMADALFPVIGKDKVVFMLLQGAGHGDPAFSTAQNMALVVDFLNKHLK
jgi:acetyl esterase/lipase